MTDRQEQIRRRAYAIWEREGRPDGQDLHHWQTASEEVERSDGKVETVEDLLAEGSRDEVALLQGAGESGDPGPPPAKLPDARTSPAAPVKGTRSDRAGSR